MRQHGSVRGAEPIHYGTNIVALPEETGSNGENKPVSKVKRLVSTRPSSTLTSVILTVIGVNKVASVVASAFISAIDAYTQDSQAIYYLESKWQHKDLGSMVHRIRQSDKDCVLVGAEPQFTTGLVWHHIMKE